MVGMLLMRARCMDVEGTNLSMAPYIHRPMHIFVREMGPQFEHFEGYEKAPATRPGLLLLRAQCRKYTQFGKEQAAFRPSRGALCFHFRNLYSTLSSESLGKDRGELLTASSVPLPFSTTCKYSLNRSSAVG